MKRRSGFQIMKRLIVELKPLAPIMAITISMGVVGFLAAIAIASFGAIAIGAAIGDITFISFTGAMVVMAVSALLRGFLRYGEQLSGHYIAFKILYILRDIYFATQNFQIKKYINKVLPFLTKYNIFFLHLTSPS